MAKRLQNAPHKWEKLDYSTKTQWETNNSKEPILPYEEKNIQKVVTKKFCLLVKREVKSIVGLVVATCNIYTTCVRDLPHPALAQVFVWHK